MSFESFHDFQQWTEVYQKKNPIDSDAFTTGFCNLPLSLNAGYKCLVSSNYYNNWGISKNVSPAVENKRHGNLMIDASSKAISEINGFWYGIDFSPTTSSIGIEFQIFVVCIKL